ncbi:lysophospholipid acyltransferase family protein [Anaerovorax odorimutans]|uniref:lysophospholipid acyltransferase family protein n=1 Tax=Anaerovorax odorimutans TaxID=109327 RepID=UPI00040B98BA|nr:lysophospholipid acyltransferase family protein [Anaerovorax odorimutans]
MRTIIWFIYFWLYLILVWPYSLYINFKTKRNQAPLDLIYKVVHKWASRLLFLAGVKVTVKGLENIPKGGALIVSNHQGNFDIPILLSKLDKPKSIIAKLELSRLPGISSWMKHFHCLFLDRGNARQSLKIMKEAQELIDNGLQVIIFPEGTRSKGSTPGEFQPAALKSALSAEAPIVPVAIDGSYKVMEEHGFWIHPAEVKLTILPPIETCELSKERKKNLHNEVRDQIINIISN